MARSIEVRDLPSDPRNCTGQIRPELTKAFNDCKSRKVNLESYISIVEAALSIAKAAYKADYAEPVKAPKKAAKKDSDA